MSKTNATDDLSCYVVHSCGTFCFELRSVMQYLCQSSHSSAFKTDNNFSIGSLFSPRMLRVLQTVGLQLCTGGFWTLD
jgi:hypothetical protein